ncbi:MAG TPA: hypothetical protein VNK23_12925 [Candidatus Dormibacteraeota bacterium]|nr:hypothetical protein [Candidatus Dormibacteraeota bacterium]
MMDCSQFRELLADLDRPGVLAAELRDQALVHAELCGDCGQLLTESESLDADLRRLIVKDGYSRAAMRVEANVLKAFRDKKAAEQRQSMGWFAAAIGVAAVVLLSLGFWLYRGLPRSRGPAFVHVTHVSPPSPVPPKAAADSDREPQVAVQGAGSSDVVRGESSKSAGKLAADSSTLVASDDSAAFIPLPDAGYPATLDDGAVVRVEMPRADLAAFGLPVEAMEGDGTVRADLIVSADGTPQAIRLVSQDDANATAQR